MHRLLLGTLAVVAVASSADAQPRGRGFGGGFSTPQAPGGGFRMLQGFGPGFSTPQVPGGGSGFRMVQRPLTPPGLGPGFTGDYGYGYGWGGFVSGGYGYNPYFVVPQAVGGGGGGAPIPVGPVEPSGATAVSGILPATLVIDYPAAAKVWLDGVEVPGDADTSWTFTSRDLKRGETVTFRVRGRWTAGGKTYESVREIPLGPGARSRLLVVSGNEVRE